MWKVQFNQDEDKIKIGTVIASYINDTSGETLVSFSQRVDTNTIDFRSDFIKKADEILSKYTRQKNKQEQVEQTLTDLLNNR